MPSDETGVAAPNKTFIVQPHVITVSTAAVRLTGMCDQESYLFILLVLTWILLSLQMLSELS